MKALQQQFEVGGDWVDSSQYSWLTACCREPAQKGGCEGWGCHSNTVLLGFPVCLFREGKQLIIILRTFTTADFKL